MKIKGNSEGRKQALISTYILSFQIHHTYPLDFDDQLDLIQVQESLRSALIGSSRRLPPQDALTAYLDKNLHILHDRLAFSELVTDLARRLVDGQALDIEGLVDVLTLKDNAGEEERRHPGIALDRLRGDSVS